MKIFCYGYYNIMFDKVNQCLYCRYDKVCIQLMKLCIFAWLYCAAVSDNIKNWDEQN